MLHPFKPLAGRAAGRRTAGRWPVVDPRVHEPDADPYRVPEAVVQDVWNGQFIDHSRLFTTQGERIRIFDPGRWNSGHGPDFTTARLAIGETTWSGDVEVHRTSSDWAAHGHHRDRRYNAVVLHVTLVRDAMTGALTRADGTLLPELVLFPYLTTSLRRLLHRFYLFRDSPIACADSWPDVPERIRAELVLESARDRLDRRADSYALHQGLGVDPVERLYRLSFRALGYTSNADAMEELATRVPLDVARRAGRSPEGSAPLLLRAAGLSEELTSGTADNVEPAAEEEFHVVPMHESAWTLSRVRPANAPFVRILQASSWLRPGGWLASDPVGPLFEIVEGPRPLAGLRRLLILQSASSGWSDVPALGPQRRDVLIANVILPFIHFIASLTGRTSAEPVIWDLMGAMPAEPDSVTSAFVRLGEQIGTALLSQGYHELFQSRCHRGRCLTCPVGRRILAGSTEPSDAQT